MPKKVNRKSEISSLLENVESRVQTAVLPKKSRFRRLISLLLLLIFVGFLVYKNKQWFVAAIVNGKPISRIDLNNELTKRYGTRTLDAIISENLVAEEVKKQNVNVSNEELDAKIAELSKGLPQGMSFEEALKSQGVSASDFKDDLRLQIAVDKLLGKEVSVSAKEIEDYIKENKQTLPATEPAALTRRVEENIRQQKIAELFQGWFASLKEKASIQRFL